MFYYYYSYNPFFYYQQFPKFIKRETKSPLNYNANTNARLSSNKDKCKNLQNRLESLEPTPPRNIDDPPWEDLPFPTKIYPISEVVEKGNEIPLYFAYNDPQWKRQAYKSYWTSEYGRWSYMPIRIHYAMHQLFTTYPTASIYYDFVHDLGIVEESKQFTKKHNGVFDYINTVVMNAEVLKIITYGNQVVIIAKPQRNGLQVLDVPTKEIKPIDPDEFILFQLVTELEDEIDYSLIDYVVK